MGDESKRTARLSREQKVMSTESLHGLLFKKSAGEESSVMHRYTHPFSDSLPFLGAS